ncbi:MAG: hypothetical protein MZW92_02815, partial [Comamonadaceae bacterium]|nr:hypothetical protein [Comamonadaceae bacterium]
HYVLLRLTQRHRQLSSAPQRTPFVSQLLDREQQEQQDLSAARASYRRELAAGRMGELASRLHDIFMLFVVVGTSGAIRDI